MPRATLIQTNFAAGELSPKLHGRLDIPKYFAGLETLENMIVFPHGGASRRAGSQFITPVKPGVDRKVRLVPFEFSIAQSYILEFGHNYIRFFRDKGQISAVFTITGATQANPVVITSANHSLLNGQNVLIENVVGMTELNGNTYEVANVADNTFELLGINGTGFTAYTSGGTATLVQGGPFENIFNDSFDNASVAQALEIVTTYAEDELFELQFVQSADVLYIVHKNHPPATLSRTSHTAWMLDDIVFVSEPSEWVASNYPQVIAFFEERLWLGATPNEPQTLWASQTGDFVNFGKGEGVITGITQAATAVVTSADHPFNNGDTITITEVVGMTEVNNRSFVLQNVTQNTYELTGENSSAHTAYTSGGVAKRVSPIVASDALEYTIATDQVNAIRWLSPGKILIAGTAGGEFSISGTTLEEAITPANIRIVRVTNYGSAFMQPIRVSNKILFTQRAERKIRQLVFNFDTDGYIAPDLTILAEHITETGIVQVDYQQEPNSIAWVVLTNGELIGLTYQPDEDVIGWHRHIIGGAVDLAGSNAVVESVSVIPPVSPTGRDEVWIVVKRCIGTTVVRYIEVIDAGLEEGESVEDSRFVDSFLQLDNPVTISGMTQADPVVVTATAHGFSNGDTVLIDDVTETVTKASSQTDFSSLNKTKFLVANTTANTFEITDVGGNNIDGSGFLAYVNGGEVRLVVSTVTGLDHLNGETVDILGDGAVLTSQLVVSGLITLSTPSAKVIIGLNYESKLKTLRLEGGSLDGTSQTKTKRIHEVGVRLYKTVGIDIGSDEDALDPVPFRDASDNMDEPIPLFTGDKLIPFEGGYDTDVQIIVKQTQPLPFTVLALIAKMKTNN